MKVPLNIPKVLLRERIIRLILDDVRDDLGASHAPEFQRFCNNRNLNKAIDKVILISRRIFTEEGGFY